MARYRRDRDALAAEMMPPVAKVASLDADMPTVQQAFVDMAGAMRHEFAYLESKATAAMAA